MDERYVELACAVYKQCCNDYITAVRKNDRDEMDHCEWFFRYGWARELMETPPDAQSVIKQLQTIAKTTIRGI